MFATLGFTIALQLSRGKDGKATSPWTFATLEACGGIRSTANDLLSFVDRANQEPDADGEQFHIGQ